MKYPRQNDYFVVYIAFKKYDSFKYPLNTKEITDQQHIRTFLLNTNLPTAFNCRSIKLQHSTSQFKIND